MNMSQKRSIESEWESSLTSNQLSSIDIQSSIKRKYIEIISSYLSHRRSNIVSISNNPYNSTSINRKLYYKYSTASLLQYNNQLHLTLFSSSSSSSSNISKDIESQIQLNNVSNKTLTTQHTTKVSLLISLAERKGLRIKVLARSQQNRNSAFYKRKNVNTSKQNLNK